MPDMQFSWLLPELPCCWDQPIPSHIGCFDLTSWENGQSGWWHFKEVFVFLHIVHTNEDLLFLDPWRGEYCFGFIKKPSFQLDLCLVDHRPLLILQVWSYVVFSDLGECCAMVLGVSPDHDANGLLLMALYQIGLIGNLAAVRRYLTSCGCIFNL